MSDWLEPGDSVLPDDLSESESRQGVTVQEGDILLVRTGHATRLDELGPWDTAGSKAGLHPSCAEFLADRRIAALGWDGNNDTAPSFTEGVGFPIHVLALTAMGVHLLDYLHLDDWAAPARSSAAGSSCSSALRSVSREEPDRRSTRSRSCDGPSIRNRLWSEI